MQNVASLWLIIFLKYKSDHEVRGRNVKPAINRDG
jgi:hypothetical protein